MCFRVVGNNPNLKGISNGIVGIGLGIIVGNNPNLKGISNNDVNG